MALSRLVGGLGKAAVGQPPLSPIFSSAFTWPNLWEALPTGREVLMVAPSAFQMVDRKGGDEVAISLHVPASAPQMAVWLGGEGVFPSC